MRVLAISHLFPHPADPQHGIFAARQFAGFQKQGAETVVFFSTIWIPGVLGYIKDKWKNYASKHEPLTDYGLNAIQIPCVRLTKGLSSCRWDGIVLYHAMKKKALQLHREKPFDVIYGRGLFPGADTAARLSNLLKIPAVGVAIGYDVNEVPYYSSSMRHYFLSVIQRLDGIFANGRGLAEKIQSDTGRNCQTTHGIVDLDVFCPARNKGVLRRELGISLQSQVLLYVGYLIKDKGLYELLQAFRQIHKDLPETMLIMCGRGVESEKLNKFVCNHNLSDAVRFAGQIAPSQVHQWMQASDIFVFPSYMEGMPNAVMEAMACGLPTIATKVGGLPDDVGDNQGAILIEPRTVEPLAAAMSKVCTDKSLREQMSVAARQTAEMKFGLESNVKKTLAYLQDVIERYPKT